ncbi:MAG: site-2 protease family protein [Actinomycetota bacterium]
MGSLVELVLVVPALLIAVTVHEYAHGKVAEMLGDPTARHAGRLSLNPIHHLDPLGTLMLLIFHIGWAKPVPVNPAHFENPKRDMMYVGLAGPMANFITAFVASFLMRSGFIPRDLGYSIFFYILRINVALGIFNLIPIPPLDGLRIMAAFIPSGRFSFYRWLERYGVLILVLLMFVFPRFLTPIIDLILGLFLPGATWR